MCIRDSRCGEGAEGEGTGKRAEMNRAKFLLKGKRFRCSESQVRKSEQKRTHECISASDGWNGFQFKNAPALGAEGGVTRAVYGNTPDRIAMGSRGLE